MVKQTAEMAKQKVKELEDELQARQKHFDTELLKVDTEYKMLKQQLGQSGTRMQEAADS